MDVPVEPAAAPAPPAPAPLTPAPAPDWPTIERDILCPLCKYNLRGLVQPRCPECGYRFDWDELLQPERLLQEYLFESRPESNGRSFFHTLWKSLRPARFWSSISPSQRPSAARLVLYWVVASAPLAALFAALAWRRGGALDVERTVRWLVIGTINGAGWYYSQLDLLDVLGLIAIAAVIWPWVTLLALNVFIESMVRTKIDGVHVLRCVTYTTGCVTFTVGIALSAVTLAAPAAGPQLLGSDAWWVAACAAALTVLWAWLTWRLIVAYRLYLRFDRPVATVLASQLIVLLAMVTVVMWAAFYGAV